MKRLAIAVSSLATFLSFATPTFGALIPDPGDGSFVPIGAVNGVFENILNAAAVLSGFVVFAFLLVGGFRYIMARGDPKALASARMTLFWAIAGLVFIIASYLIIALIANLTGIAKIGTFCLPGGPKDC